MKIIDEYILLSNNLTHCLSLIDDGKEVASPHEFILKLATIRSMQEWRRIVDDRIIENNMMLEEAKRKDH